MGLAWDEVQVGINNLGYRSRYDGNTICDWYGWGGYWAWCDAFVSWCAHYSDNAGAVGKFAYCPNHVAFFKNQDRWIEKWEPCQSGDIVFFDWNLDGVADHVGIIWGDDGYGVSTVEGNTNTYPGEVASHYYAKLYACIMGYGRPAYTGVAGEAPVTPEVPWTPPAIVTDYSVKCFAKTADGLFFDAKDGEEIDTGGRPITGIAAIVDNGSIWYQAHDAENDWNGKVTGCDWNDYDNGWAGDNVPIDLVRMYLNSVNGDKVIKYRVAPIGQGYFDWQRDDQVDSNQDGFAGDYGLPIDRIQIVIDNY